jgi:hypothetical protein
VINPNFHYRELDREIATKARYNTDVSDRLTSGMQAKLRRKFPNTSFRDYIVYK